MITIHGIYITRPHKERAEKIAEKLEISGIEAFKVLSGRDMIIAVRPEDVERACDISEETIMDE